MVFMTIRGGEVCVSREVGENELIERVHRLPVGQTWRRLGYYESQMYFGLIDTDNKKQTISILEFGQGDRVSLLEKQQLKEYHFNEAFYSAERKIV